MSGPRVPLRAFGGQAAPPELAGDLLLLLELPAEARERLWSILGPCVPERLPGGLEREVDAFERSFGLRPDLLPRALRACRLLVRAAAMRGLDRAALAADALDLTGSEEPGRVLVLGYDAARALVLREAVRASLLEHGAVLDSVDWRVDQVGGSSRRDGLSFTFAVLTLRYERDGRQERLTLQVPAETLIQLEEACKTMLGRGGSGSIPKP